MEDALWTQRNERNHRTHESRVKRLMEDALWTQRNERNHRTHESRVKRLMEDALWTQGLRAKLESGKRRHEFQTDHGFRKWFKTRCELVGMKPINIEKLMNHSIGMHITEQPKMTF
jgi:hypothetical protein